MKKKLILLGVGVITVILILMIPTTTGKDNLIIFENDEPLAVNTDYHLEHPIYRGEEVDIINPVYRGEPFEIKLL